MVTHHLQVPRTKVSWDLGLFSGKTRKVPGKPRQLVTLLGEATSDGGAAHSPMGFLPLSSRLLSLT